MSRRIDIELTSFRGDGTWTWRAAGAKAPKGVVAAAILPAASKTGDVLKVEADFDIDGISVLGVVAAREKTQRRDLLEMIVDDKIFAPVTQKLSERAKSDRQDSRGPRAEKRGARPDGAGPGRDSRRPSAQRTPGSPDRPRRPIPDRPTDSKDPKIIAPRKARRPMFKAPPELPKRPAAKRLKPKQIHRAAILETLPDEQRAVAQRALAGGIKAVRDAVKEQNDKLRSAGQSPVPAEGLISMAQNLLPKLRVAEWLDRAEAAMSDIAHLDLRDLRSVVVGADDPMVVRDESTRALAAQLKVALKERQEQEQILWRGDIVAALGVSRVVRALKLSGEPPKAGQPFPADLGAQLTAAAAASLTAESSSERWIAILEAVAFSPIRGHVKPTVKPANPSEALVATVKRLAPLVPQIAGLFEITAVPSAHAPRPLRPTRPTKPIKSANPAGKHSGHSAPSKQAGAIPPPPAAAEPVVAPVVGPVVEPVVESAVDTQIIDSVSGEVAPTLNVEA